MSMNVDRILAKDQAVFVLTESTTLNVYVRREELAEPVKQVIFFLALFFKPGLVNEYQHNCFTLNYIAECDGKADIVIMLDTSGSIRESRFLDVKVSHLYVSFYRASKGNKV